MDYVADVSAESYLVQHKERRAKFIVLTGKEAGIVDILMDI